MNSTREDESKLLWQSLDGVAEQLIKHAIYEASLQNDLWQ